MVDIRRVSLPLFTLCSGDSLVKRRTYTLAWDPGIGAKLGVHVGREWVRQPLPSLLRRRAERGRVSKLSWGPTSKEKLSD